MANRTISLSPIADLIRKKIVKGGTPFSLWVQEALLEWNLDDSKKEVVEKPKVPWNYQCQLCRRQGHHHSDCSMYNPELHDPVNIHGDSQ